MTPGWKMSHGTPGGSIFELALREFLARRRKAARDSRDTGLLDRHAEELNREIADVLEFQGET